MMLKKVFYLFLAIILVLAMFTGTGIVTAADSQDWPMFHHDSALSGYTNGKAPNTDTVAWTYDTGAPGMVSSPAIVDSRLYIGGMDSKLYALSAENGEPLWTFLADAPIYSSPAVADERVYFLDESGKVYALNTITGATIWSTIIGNGPWDWSSPAIHDSNIFIASSNGWVHSLNATTGSINWSTYVGGNPNSMIAVANGKVFSGTHNVGDTSSPTLVALNEANGNIIWTYNYHLLHSGVIGMVNCNGAAVVDGDGDGSLEVYFGVYNWNGIGPQAIALNEADGTEEWAVNIGGNSTSTPAVHEGVVFIGSDDGKVYALNAGNGSQKWTFQTGDQVWSSPVVANSKVFVGSWDHTLYALNERDGRLVWSYYTGTSRLYGSPAVANGRVFIGNENGKVYAFGSRPKAVPIVTSFDPSSGCSGTPVTIEGENFRKGMTTVRFGNIEVDEDEIIRISKSQIKVRVPNAPEAAMTGKITVTTPKGTTVSTQNFIVVPPSQPWQMEIDSYNSVVAYSNGGWYSAHRNSDGNLTRSDYGLAYQCVEYINRFYALALGHTDMVGTGHAESYFRSAEGKELIAYPNGEETAPQVNDILVFDDNRRGGRLGHVAIVTALETNGEGELIALRVIQQNVVLEPGGAYIVTPRLVVNVVEKKNGSITYEVDSAGSGSGLPVIGWSRLP